ncbi:MAG: hypothetical protein Q9195_008585 [Heterodermia aff. obscurata]
MLLFQALLFFVPIDLFSVCHALSIGQDHTPKIPKVLSLKSVLKLTTKVGTVYDYQVHGSSTKIRFTTLSDRFMINTPDTYMCLTSGLLGMTRAIAARGGKSLVGKDELEFDYESADLQLEHSDQGPGGMELAVLADLLYGIAFVIFADGLHVEVKLDVWDGRLHVGTGWLLNKDHPQARDRVARSKIA